MPNHEKRWLLLLEIGFGVLTVSFIGIGLYSTLKVNGDLRSWVSHNSDRLTALEAKVEQMHEAGENRSEQRAERLATLESRIAQAEADISRLREEVNDVQRHQR